MPMPPVARTTPPQPLDPRPGVSARYVVCGATGRVGSAVATGLLTAGRQVRVVVRRDDAAEAWRERGADVSLADLRDEAAVRAALDGADGFFAMMPFDLTAHDLDGYAAQVTRSVASAVRMAGVPHTVLLSSGGADQSEGTGPILGLHAMEQALGRTGTTLTALRPVHFQEKVTDLLDAARYEGVYPVFAATADEPVPMVATQDVAAVAVAELLAGPRRSETVDVVGPVSTERQVAELLGHALGRELNVVTIPQDAWDTALREAGFPEHIAASLAELYRADASGALAPRGDRRIEVTTPVQATIARLLGTGDQVDG